MTSVLIVDDHAGFRSWARRLLEAHGFEVVGEAADGHTALAAVKDRDPEAVLLDIRLPDLNGFQVADRLTAGGTTAKIVLVSTRVRADYTDRLEESGVVGFITKSELTPQRLRALLLET